ncbi:MAG TPA: hypothetical protein VL357_00305 [Rariglobus sp.]|jgi:uncharacterized membrane protein YccC|nr:hypothetical protein [Rariglobus sp.]
MKTLIENLELVLTCAGLLVIIGVSLLLGAGTPGYWPLLTLTAAGVGVLHGFIFWIVRRRQRTLRRKTLAEAQQMLKDVINNQLAVIQMTRETPHSEGAASDNSNQRVIQAIHLISETLQNISEESLRRWHSQYSNRGDEES